MKSNVNPVQANEPVIQPTASEAAILPPGELLQEQLIEREALLTNKQAESDRVQAELETYKKGQASRALMIIPEPNKRPDESADSDVK